MQSVSPRLLLLPLLCHGLTFEVRAQDAVEAGADDSIETVQVLGRREGNYTIITEDAQKLVEMPGALGDPLGAITALPGVLSPAGGGAPAVRGSSPADNRYYIDGMPAGYIFHAFNTSIFDENIVRDFSLYPAGFGAEYANATGAVFDIRLRDPARQSLLTTVNASFLRAGVLVESGLTENSAFYLSLRRGLVEFIYPEDDEPNEDGIRVQSAPMDSDYVFKYLWSSEPGNRLSFNLVGARDGAGAEFTEKSRLAQENPDFAGDASLKDAFDSQSLVWDRAWSGVKLNLVLAHYENRDKLYWGDNYFHQMKLENLMFKGALAALLGRHELSLGTEANRNQYNYATRRILFVCTDLEPDCLNRRRELVEFDQRVEMKDTSVYLIDRWTPGETVELESGVQWTRDDYTDQSFVHPRFAASWRFQPQLALTASAGSYNRFPDLELVMPGIGNPALHPYEAEHYTLGLKGEFRDHWTWSAEFYHKNLKRLPLALGEDEDQFYSNQVKGEAQGVDLFLNRNRADNWYGWMSLSYATSERTNQRTGETRDYTLDTPIVLNLVANYRFHPRWDAGFRLTAKSGQATTEIIGVQENPAFPGHYSPVYGEPYADRLPFYARLDFRVSLEFEAFGNPGSLFTDVLNILNRKNVTSVGLDYEKVEETGELHLEREEEFGILGSVGVSFSF